MNFSKVWLYGMALIVSACVGGAVGEAIASGKDTRPFWTEKSAFIEGDELFVVGIASKAKTAEDGRQQAFEHGKIELMNYAQVTTLEAEGLVVETQMTFEESNADGSITVYRLLRAPLDKLLAIQRRVRSQSKAHEQGLAAVREELLIVQKSLAEKERQAEALLKVLNNEARSRGLPPSQPTGSLMNDLKQAEMLLSKEDREAALILSQVRQRVRSEQQKNEARCARLERGMTKQEVRMLLGEPDEDSKGTAIPIAVNPTTAPEKMDEQPSAGTATAKQVVEDAVLKKARTNFEEASNRLKIHEANSGMWFYGRAGRVTIHFDSVGEADNIFGCKGKF